MNIFQESNTNKNWLRMSLIGLGFAVITACNPAVEYSVCCHRGRRSSSAYSSTGNKRSRISRHGFGTTR